MTTVSDREAVIVATARSPIGRAVKGSLRDLRPDDLAATIVRAALDKVPAARPGRHRRPVPRLRPARRRAGLQHGAAWSRRCSATTTCPAATLTRYCASSLQTTRMAFHAIKAGEGDVFISAGVEMVSRYARGNSDGLPPEAQALVGGALAEPGVRRGAARAPRRSAAGGADAGTTRARTAQMPGHLPGDGPDRREPRPDQGRDPRGHGRVRRTRRRTSPRRPSPTASGPARSRR